MVLTTSHEEISYKERVLKLLDVTLDLKKTFIMIISIITHCSISDDAIHLTFKRAIMKGKSRNVAANLFCSPCVTNTSEYLRIWTCKRIFKAWAGWKCDWCCGCPLLLVNYLFELVCVCLCRYTYECVWANRVSELLCAGDIFRLMWVTFLMSCLYKLHLFFLGW